MRVPRLACVWFVVSAFMSCSAAGQGVDSSIFDTRTARYFGDAKPALTEYLKTQLPLKQTRHHFCVVGYQGSEGNKLAYVDWQEGKKLILWEGSAYPEYAHESIKNSRRQLDLTKDVVKTEADIAGSTYLVTESWVAGVKNDCRKSGAKYSVRRPK